MQDVWLWWSSGKDSAWTLHTLRQDARYRVTRLVTTLNGAAERVAMHAVRRSLLDAQAASVGVPLEAVDLPFPCTNDDYLAAVRPVIDRAAREGVTAMAFGDLFLEDVRDYRISLFDDTPIEPIFPLWGEPTDRLARTMLDAGLRAHVTCVDPSVLPSDFAGRPYDSELLAALPSGVDPCGENGEMHTFVHEGPIFARPIDVEPGEIVERDGFVFADLTLA